MDAYVYEKNKKEMICPKKPCCVVETKDGLLRSTLKRAVKFTFSDGK